MNNKNLGIIIFVTVLSILFWYLADKWILSPTRLGDIQLWVSLLVSFIVLVSSLVIAFLILSKHLFKLTLIILVAVPFFIFFKFSFYYLLSVTLMFWLMVYSIKVIKEEAVERSKINIRLILRRGLPPLLTGFFIMISFAYFLSPAVQSIAETKELPPTFNQAVREVFDVMFKGDLEQLTPVQREQSGNRFVSEFVGEANRIIKPFFNYLPPMISFGLFLVLQGLSFLFIWLAIPIGMVIFGILKKLNFFKIKEVQVKSEMLEV